MMKALPFQIPKTGNTTLIIQKDEGKTFYNLLHQHPEIQISLIVKGSGTCIVGDGITDFKPGDVFIIGSNLPHLFRSDIRNESSSEMISIFFTTDSYGSDFFDHKEFEHLRNFLEETHFGIKIPHLNPDLKNQMQHLQHFHPFKRFILFLNLLDAFSKTERELLSSQIDLKKYSENEGKRMQDIFSFTLRNSHRKIRLQEVSEIAYLSQNAFCRYFKQRTNKSYFRFVTEIRVENACNLLLKHPELSIADIAYQSGFNNLANFNRKFKNIKQLTPSAFRKKHTQATV